MSNKKIILRIIENWPVKVLSVALAIILFVFHRLNTQTTRQLSVPLSVETTAVMIPASPYPRQIRVTLRGDDNGILSIADGDIEAYVDFTRYDTEGSYSAPVQVRRKGTALDIEPLEIAVSPLRVSLELDQRINKVLPLIAAIQGRAADGFDFVSHTISPPQITVTGPRGFLESISEIKTVPIDIDRRSTNFNIEVNIENPNSLFIIRGGGMAEVSCHIRPSVSVRSIVGIPIAIAGLKPGFEAVTGGKTGSIRIEGNQSQLDDFQAADDLFTVDCTNILEAGTYTLPVKVTLPPLYSLLRHEPDELILTVRLKSGEDEEGAEL